jgi:hypothetical protein
MRFCLATEIIEDALDFLRLAFFGAVFAGIAFLEMAGQAALRPDPDAFPAEVCPRSAITMARSQT